MHCLSLPLAALLLVQLPMGPEIVIQAGPRRVLRRPDTTFTRASAPDGMGREDAYTRSRLAASCRMETAGDLRVREGEDGHCRITFEVSRVEFSLDLELQVLLPPAAGATLRAHEEGHVEINRQTFLLAAEPVARSVLQDFAGRVAATMPPPCSPRAAQAVIQVALDELCGRFSRSISQDLNAEMEGVNVRFDRTTDYGRRGGSESDQLRAARRALAPIEKKYSKPRRAPPPAPQRPPG